MAVLSNDELTKIKARFNAYDTDQSGSITEDECKKILEDYMSEDEITKFFVSIDLDKNGRITFEEFEKNNS